jgi:hypothetical protein
MSQPPSQACMRLCQKPGDPNVRAQNTLSEDVFCAKTKDCPYALHSKVVSDSQAHQLMTDLAGVTVMYMNIRYLN